MNRNTIKKSVKIRVPARLHIDVMDIQNLNIGRVGGGGIGVAIDMSSYITIKVIESKEDIINSKKDKLVKYILDLMREVSKIKEHFKVDCNFDTKLKTHNGMGSNAILQMGIAFGVNYIYDKPLTNHQLIEIIQKNYCEEEEKHIIKDVYCSGVAHNTIIFGGICFIDDKGKLIYSKKLPQNVKVGVVKATFGDIFNDKNVDKDDLIVNLRKENDINRYYNIKDNIIRNKIIPDLKKDEYISLFKEVKEFAKFDDSNILSKICKINGISYNKFYNMIKNIPNLIFRVSSNSPYVCIITDCIKGIKEICDDNNIDLNIYDVNNKGIEVIEEE